MSLVVIPQFTHRPLPITTRWWIQLLGHFPFVGIPIVAMISKGIREGGCQGSGAPARKN